MASVTSDFVVISDANSFLDPDAISLLVRNFEDPGVVCVSGDVVLVGVRAMLGRSEWLDDQVEHSECRYDREILAVEHWLGQAPVGTYVLTYNGLGSELPRSYREIRADQTFRCNLRLYRKIVDRP